MALTFDPPLHPGEVLREQFLEPLGLSAGALARGLGVPRTRIERLARQEMGISADTALRLAKYFDTTPNVWLNMQAAYDLSVGATSIKGDIDAIRPHQPRNDNRANHPTKVTRRR